ncbi:response regulator [Natronolimnohabitans innermongolicus]|uniref:response regulator n=1 Tax=Natronolimnohabitans innermongolicus TaxID=253107 RepID=UPI00137642FD|nr:response regulator [Natronolimnohabitans innermongolicus]
MRSCSSKTPPGDVRLTREAITEAGVERTLLTFPTGEQALEYLVDDETALPTLVFLDLKLPGMDGCEILEKIRARKRISPDVPRGVHRDDRVWSKQVRLPPS